MYMIDGKCLRIYYLKNIYIFIGKIYMIHAFLAAVPWGRKGGGDVAW